MRLGYVLLGVSLIALIVDTFASGLLPLDEYPVEQWRFAANAIASPLIPICFISGMVCWAIGYIVFAISFLPGSEDNAPDR